MPFNVLVRRSVLLPSCLRFTLLLCVCFPLLVAEHRVSFTAHTDYVCVI